MVFRDAVLEYDNFELLRDQRSRDKGHTKVKKGRTHNHIMSVASWTADYNNN